MIKLIGAVVGAFFLFLVGFPLAGFLVTLILKVFLPYLLVPAAIAVLLKGTLDWGGAMSAVLFFGVTWAVLVLFARKGLRRGGSPLAWHEGHYLAARHVLGIPFRRGKASIEESAEEIPSGAETV